MHKESNIKIICLDLDGTLLNSDKQLSPRNAAALERAAAAGAEIVPTTGRFFTGMPQFIQDLPYLHYAITINGAQVYDIRKDCAVARNEMPLETALRILEYLDDQPVAYDCYQDNWGWMSRRFWEHIEDYTPDPHYHEMVHRLRTPLDDLKTTLRERGKDVQKLQAFIPDISIKAQLIADLSAAFPEAAVTTSVPNNIEINDRNCHKGAALRQLADYLGVPIGQTAAFGDGSNDTTMIREAGKGVCMANGCEASLAAADIIAPDCDEDGVAKVLEQMGF